MTEKILLEIRGLSMRFGGLRAVDDVTMDLRAGIVTALVGPNGAGKTTLFNLITGHLAPTEGDVTWRGASLLGKPSWMIARNGIARSFQDLRLFTHMTVGRTS
ncbi:MAG: ATP-binding cassette domain-containing protein [Xanthobacteraceae bacterium]|nr:ATP-binding cassette domain-containing protein [Xanthobacteraceae bacterium]